MKDLSVYQIYDSLAEHVTHTFTAASDAHAFDQFRRFVESVKKWSDPENFHLFLLGVIEVCESNSDCVDFMNSNQDQWTYDELCGGDFDESKS